MLVKMPHHVLQVALSYLNIDDLRNISCTSSQHKSLMVPFMWRNVSLNEGDLDGCILDDKKCRNMRFTSCLKLLNQLGKKTGEESLVNYGMNVSKLLQHLLPTKVTRLTLRSPYSKSVAQHMMKTFQCLQYLELCSVELEDWRGVLGKSVKNLKLKNCNMPDPAFLEILASNRVEYLWISDCPQISMASFENADDLATVTDFSCWGNILLKTHIDCSCCLKMFSLERLSLWGIDATDETIQLICKNLGALRVLDLRYLRTISHEAFSQVGLLKKLHHLCFETCDMSSNVFQYVKSCTSLKTLQFRADWLTFHDTSDRDVAMLNEMPMLTKVRFRALDSDVSVRVLGCFCDKFAWNLVMEKLGDSPVIYCLSK